MTTRAGKRSDVGIDIDELTPCLRRTSTNQPVKTTVERISPTRTDTAGWEFDWTKPERNGFQVYALKANGDSRVQGMIALRNEPTNNAVYVDIVEAAPHNSLHNPMNTQHTKVYSGVGGHLFAEAARQSYEQGYGGYVYFRAKTHLIEYYQEQLGAQIINVKERTMAIDEVAAKKLIERYFGGV